MEAAQNHSTLLIILLLAPLASAVLTLLLRNRKGALWLSVGGVIISFVSAVLLFNSPESSAIHFTWLSIGEGRTLTFGFSFDWLSRIIAALVTFVSLLVHVYSVGYMRHDTGINRYFAFLGLFTFSMLGIVLSQSLLMVFFFWELVGFTSYLLIGFWYQKASANQAAKKAFIVNRIGDLGFLAGIALLWGWLGTMNLDELQSIFAVAQYDNGYWLLGITELSNLALIGTALALFCGVIGKSAQFPLQVWLPDAMEGPTPVSALIHAATMVAAGVFLLARIFFIFPVEALTVVAIIGAITALIGAIAALTQTDIKKVLAFSTISQLGYMVLAMGVGAWFAALFHMITHAFFKAALFLSSGSVIHSMHEWEEKSGQHIDPQDMRYMGGLRKQMPVTFYSYLIAMLSLAGLPFFSGFLSKDAIIVEAWAWASNLSGAGISVFHLIPIIALLTAFLTAFYMGRQLFLVFFGKRRLPISEVKPIEVEGWMKWPTAILSLLSLGFFYSLNPLDGEATWLNDLLKAPASLVSSTTTMDTHSLHLIMAAVTVFLAVAGIAVAYKKYTDKTPTAADQLSPIGKFSYHQLYFNRAYHSAFVQPFTKLSSFIARFDHAIIDGLVNLLGVMGVVLSQLLGWIDRYIVDGIVNSSAWLSGRFGQVTRGIQGGNAQSYLLWGVVGILLMMVWVFQFIAWKVTF
ncbi:MAG: NADH-quinone oxidoreductase subunit L [Cyclobacteriaceae bacterium]